MPRGGELNTFREREQFEELSIRKLVGFGGMLLDEPAEPHNRAQRLWTAAPRPLRSSQAHTLPRTMWVYGPEPGLVSGFLGINGARGKTGWLPYYFCDDFVQEPI
jgi:hypothetical protein